jgi:heme-degrading monooxygenase HmoA
MIGVFVTFRYGDNFDEQAVRKIAETARARFEGMPGLRSKAFTVNSGKREATNFYVWDSEDAAKAFFTDALLERVTGLYGVRPSVEFVQIATLVENARAWRRQQSRRGKHDAQPRVRADVPPVALRLGSTLAWTASRSTHLLNDSFLFCNCHTLKFLNVANMADLTKLVHMSQCRL